MASDLRIKARKIVHELKRLSPKTKIALHYSNPWELLVAVVLSAQTTDKKVNEVTAKLFSAKGGKYRTFEDYLKADLKDFQNDIKQIGLYRGKAKNILETANIILGNAYGIVEGIAVDTHVRRLSKLFGLTKHDDPVKIEKDLMMLLPKKEWFKFTYRMIDYGRKYCTARCKHENCPLRKFI